MKVALNNPGESSQRRLDDLLAEEGHAPLIVALMAVVFAGLEWVRHAADIQPHPWLASGFAVAACVMATVKVRRTLRAAKNLKLGIAGEKSVAETLDELKARGYRVFHDIEADGFNVDHVAIGPAGVFAIETKNRTKPTGRRAEVVFDGERVLVDGYVPDRDPVGQARACAGHIGKRLRDVIGNDVFVRPVVLFPDWWVHEGPPDSKVWVLNPTRLLTLLRGERAHLSEQQVSRLAAVISDAARLARR